MCDRGAKQDGVARSADADTDIVWGAGGESAGLGRLLHKPGKPGSQSKGPAPLPVTQQAVRPQQQRQRHRHHVRDSGNLLSAGVGDETELHSHEESARKTHFDFLSPS